jgi:UDP-N-acetylmuramyl pentapeptide synthase
MTPLDFAPYCASIVQILCITCAETSHAETEHFSNPSKHNSSVSIHSLIFNDPFLELLNSHFRDSDFVMSVFEKRMKASLLESISQGLQIRVSVVLTLSKSLKKLIRRRERDS